MQKIISICLCHDLVAEFDDHAFGGPGADAADVLEDLDVGVDDSVAEGGDIHAAEDGEGGLRADAVHCEQEFEDLEFLLLREPEELERVLADLEPGQDRGGAALLRQDVVGAHGDGDEISDAVHVEDEFGEVQGDDFACELSDHVRASFPARAHAGFPVDSLQYYTCFCGKIKRVSAAARRRSSR